MKPTSIIAIGFLAVTLCFTPSVRAQDITVYNGRCDASAAVALGAEHFVVANDERNVLQVYRRGQPNAVGSVDVSKFLGTAQNSESDLEGAAMIGTRIYWISSHGRNRNAKVREERYRFFATEVQQGQPPAVTPIGQPYTQLLNDLLAAAPLKKYDLATAATRAPEAENGLNIEGLAATLDGKLLIGFRNPVPGKRALVVPLENPNEVVNGGARARLGEPIELDLGGRGIRSIELVGSSYLIVAGPTADTGSFMLYRWPGPKDPTTTPAAGIDFRDLTPEALFAIPNTTLVQILSDDGGLRVNGVDCKDLPPSKQFFRSITIDAGKR